ncbi:hypothetical protein ACJDU8_04470 [Clostridium sp. WILCCON 0269]|uniref:Uncharacterized protein n=1 Tax=Candidatus Clostridium eludens TaxID=3381663 RepID=A0ABW8SFS1_9CLOT
MPKNQEFLKNLVNNFNEYEWNYDNANKIGTYKNDFNLQVKLQNKRRREEDESLKGNQWDDLFRKYPNSQSVEVTFLYRGAEVDGYPALIFKNVIIPLPIAANMINEFYENELRIARVFSDDKNSFDKILSGIEQRKKNY